MFYNNIPYTSLINTRTFLGLPKINWTTLLTNTSKTLNVINQATGAYYQIKPIITNTRNIFKIAHEIKKEEPKKKTETSPIFYT